MPGPKINPSTYKQVVENAAKLLQLVGQLGDLSELPYDLNELARRVEELSNKILDVQPDPDTGGIGTEGDVVNSGTGVKVIGIHVNTSKTEENSTIDEYAHGVTFEFKNSEVIGVKGKTGMTGDYCFIMTVKKDSPIAGEPETLGAKEFQIAYGTDGIYMFRREVTPEGGWGEWQERVDPKPQEVRQQFVQSDTQPTDQLEGEYWCEPITTTE